MELPDSSMFFLARARIMQAGNILALVNAAGQEG